ncbi:uncharacterized protein LOC132716611 isoform X2 [Ruditapes philippinarum]|uniref:uncharacterized protein LOC132716611 isoform X2 n=1 Tax=Ruditapes philippinarum TaxID=129788 RepID=UPI00295B0FFF|nr:uncharacterized protein LOC132716611 isoform X2 [Ruditapes philippinarum]
MKISFSSLLTAVLFVSLPLANALPVRPVPTEENTALKTRIPRLRSLILSGNQLTLLRERSSSSADEFGTTLRSSSDVSETDFRLGHTGNTLPSKITSENTDSSHSREIRSVTYSDTQVPVESSTENVPTQEATSSPVKEQTTTGFKEEVTTPSSIQEETTVTLTTEIPTVAPTVVLVQEYLENASTQVDYLLARLDKQYRLIGVVDYIPDERYRPSLPSDVLDNSRQCVQIELTLLAMHEVLVDFLPHLNALYTLNGDTTVYISTRTLAWFISSPPVYDYIPEGIQGTGTKNTEEVVNTLGALRTQASLMQQVISNLKKC